MLTVDSDENSNSLALVDLKSFKKWLVPYKSEIEIS